MKDTITVSLCCVWLGCMGTFGVVAFAQPEESNEMHMINAADGILRISTPPDELEIAFGAPSARDDTERLSFFVTVQATNGDKYIIAVKTLRVDDSAKWLERIREDPVTRRMFLNGLDFRTSNMNRPIIPSFVR